MNRTVSKITLVVLMGIGLQTQAISSWIKGAAAVAGTVGAYGLYLRNQNITVHQNIVENSYSSLINDIKKSVNYNMLLDVQQLDRLEKLAIYPGAQLNARVQDKRNSTLIELADTYNQSTPASKEQDEAGKRLVDTLTDLRTKKLSEISTAKLKPLAIGAATYGAAACCCFLVGLFLGFEYYPGAEDLSPVSNYLVLAARSMMAPAKLLYYGIAKS